MVTEQKARQDVLRWIETVNSHNWSLIDQAADELFAASYVWHFPGVIDLPPGPEGVKRSMRGILGDNPNFRVTLEDVFCAEDKVAIRCTARRTEPISGKPQRLTDLLISHYIGGKFAEDWELISPWEDEA